MKRVSVLAFLLTASAATVGMAQAAPPTDKPLDEAVTVFAETCLQQDFSGVDLHARLDHGKGSMLYNATQAQPFLGKEPGSAWGMRGHDSNYAIATQDNGICSVFVQKPVPGTWDDFETLLKGMFNGAELVPVSPELAGPSSDKVKSKGYQIRAKNGGSLPPIFTLVDSTDPKLNFSSRLTIYMPSSGSLATKPWLTPKT